MDFKDMFYVARNKAGLPYFLDFVSFYSRDISDEYFDQILAIKESYLSIRSIHRKRTQNRLRNKQRNLH